MTPKDWILDLLWPPDNSCQLCGRALWRTSEHVLCARCSGKLSGLRIPPADQCTMTENIALCVSAYYHAEEAAALIHALKYDNIASAAEALSPAMTDTLIRNGLADWADAAVPVPVHASRLRERGYNQAELLARPVCRSVGLPLLPEALTRVLGGKSQVGSTREERLHSRDHVFSADPQLAAGKKLLLVDDVYTTGATARSCGKALLEAGALQVRVLTATRSTRI